MRIDQHPVHTSRALLGTPCSVARGFTRSLLALAHERERECRDACVNSGADPLDPRVSPIKMDNFAGLPQALIITAEHDVLRDEGALYGEKLKKRWRSRVGVTLSGSHPRIPAVFRMDS